MNLIYYMFGNSAGYSWSSDDPLRDEDRTSSRGPLFRLISLLLWDMPKSLARQLEDIHNRSSFADAALWKEVYTYNVEVLTVTLVVVSKIFAFPKT